MPCFDPINCGHPQCAATVLRNMSDLPPPLRAGEIVQLKSGGPPVTVCEITGTKVAVAWYKEDDSLSVICLPIEAFERVPGA